MSGNGMILLGILAYLFLFELALSSKYIGLKEENLKGVLKLQHSMWMKFSHALGAVMSKIILTVLWLVGIGFYAIFWKLGHLRTKKKETYWVEIDNKENNMKYSF